MADRETYLTKDVFIAGAPPKITYNPRAERHLEQELKLYLAQGAGRTLSVSGPTKSGKTVLVERLLPRDEAIWMEGPDLTSVDVFWDRIVDWLGLYDLVEVTRQEAEGSGKQLGMSVGVPKVVSIDAGKRDDATTTQGVRKTRKQAITSVARESLEAVATPIVIDDFHYVADDAKQAMARAIKTVIPHCKVVMIAVPHEAFDVVRKEPDMGFRVSQLRIEPWSVEELRFIAERGFEALAIEDPHGVGATLAQNSYGAPFLMQELCYQYAVVSLGLLRTADEPVIAEAPADWSVFFAAIANRTPPAIFETLLKGPKMRGQRRIPRIFKGGQKTDIYGALLYAIARAGKPTVAYQDSRGSSSATSWSLSRASRSPCRSGTWRRSRRTTGEPAMQRSRIRTTTCTCSTRSCCSTCATAPGASTSTSKTTLSPSRCRRCEKAFAAGATSRVSLPSGGEDAAQFGQPVRGLVAATDTRSPKSRRDAGLRRGFRTPEDPTSPPNGPERPLLQVVQVEVPDRRDVPAVADRRLQLEAGDLPAQPVRERAPFSSSTASMWRGPYSSGRVR